MRQAQAGEGRMQDTVVVANRGGKGACVLLCDHASNRMPPKFGTLGLGAEELVAHIAWDPGALGVARHLSSLLDAPLVHPTVSRLVIDCNRREDAGDLIPEISERTAIPGNAALSEAEREERLDLVHRPFHRAIEALVDERLARGAPTFLVSVHTFTPVYKDVPRRWQIGILSNVDRRLAGRLIGELSHEEGLCVGDNEPYAPRDGVYYTLARHGEGRGLATAMLEIRNDEVATAEAERAWAERLYPVLARFGDALR
ncbi:N-formylglutamate amidohydrolase [Stappia sp. F7233]|uniref:N-formylglutamate amidohydrolase n=1 Tax=Stappia albiluteola TaxID=2758565 RepID=A0A839AIU2_9HYPH|nr:N-formylglutamate amidohydrolase [Stappia albiluteola]MBA5778842.1 N-formylglutamate amidohydrolase [Stappia albiluteola]